MLQCGHRMPSLFLIRSQKSSTRLYVWLHGTAPPSKSPMHSASRLSRSISGLRAFDRAWELSLGQIFCVSMVSGVMLMIEPYAIQSY